MDLSLWSIKTDNWSVDNFKNTRHLNELSPRYGHVTLISGYPFWQLSIDHNMNVHKDVHYQVKNRLYMPWTSS